MIGRFFVDTNVLVYARDLSESDKHERAQEWMTYLWGTRTGRVSMQVLKEYYMVVTRKLVPGLDRETAREDVRCLFRWNPVLLTRRVLEGAWLIEDQYGFSWWDSLIVSAAQESGCSYLLTEDLQEDQELGTIRVISPFRYTPSSFNL